MAKLSWISDSKLDSTVKEFRKRAQDAREEAATRLKRNVVDPFRSLLIGSTFRIATREELERLQESESALRGMSNAVGDFHQEILGSVDGWLNHDAGYDLESTTHHVVAEVKNKHNTMSATTRRQVESDLQTAIRQKGSGWTGYLVIIVPRRPRRYEKPLTIGRPVFEIDGASFYHKVTGDPNAIHDLFDVLSVEFSPSAEIAQYCREILSSSIPPRL